MTARAVLSDANILIDFEEGGLVEPIFHLILLQDELECTIVVSNEWFQCGFRQGDTRNKPQAFTSYPLNNLCKSVF